MKYNLMKSLSVFFLFLIFVIPNSFSTIKYFFIPLYIFCFFVLNQKDNNTNFKFHKYIIYFVLFNLIFIFLGLLNGATFSAFFDNIKLLVIYPLLINVVLFSFSKYITLFDFQKIALLSMLLISTFGFLLFLAILFNFQLLPDKIYSQLNIVNDASSGSFRLNYVGLNSLYYIFPISLSIFFYSNFSTKYKLLASSIILFTIIIILISGRRALIITSFISPFLLLLYLFFYKLIKIQKIFLIILFLIFIFTLILSYFYLLQTNFTGSEINLYERITSEFSDESVRVSQLPFLLNYFINHPWGSGFGVILPNSENYVRDTIQKWNFELTYLQLLCNTGIFGLFFYPTFFIFLFKKIKNTINKAKKNSIIICTILNGIQLFLLASFTNPYISSFESLLIILLPLYIVYNVKNFKY